MQNLNQSCLPVTTKGLPGNLHTQLHVMRVFLFVGILINALISSSSSVAQELAEYKNSVVGIYSPSKHLIGTGAIIGHSGLILTAKHTLVDNRVVSNGPNNFLISVLFGFDDTAQIGQADLVTVHPHLDLAILKARDDSARLLTGNIGLGIATQLTQVEVGSEVTVIGHSARTGEIKAHQLYINDVDNYGDLILQGNLLSDSRGSPVMYDGLLLGVLSTSRIDTGNVVPAALGLNHFRLMGIEFDEQGFAKQTNIISTLVSRIQRFEAILLDVQLDVDWIAALHGNRSNFSALGWDDLELRIGVKRRLASQPSFKARLNVSVTPIFANVKFARLSPVERYNFSRFEWLLPRDGMTRIANISEEIDALLRKEYSDLSLTQKDLLGLDVQANVGSISGAGLIADPEPFSICFSLRLEEPGYLATPVSTTGSRCDKQP